MNVGIAKRLGTAMLGSMMLAATMPLCAAQVDSITGTTLYAFDGMGANGADCYADLMQASDGNLYGTAGFGGAYSNGTVFRITPSGTLTTLHSFSSADGSQPQSTLIQGKDGYFYGTTQSGGAYGAGTVFRMAADGTLKTLYSFTLGADSGFPSGALVQADDGSLYGTADGASAGTPLGAIFRISPSGSFSVVHGFKVDGTEGAGASSLIMGTDGNLYGVTYSGGGPNGTAGGTFFRLTPSGMLTTLHVFPYAQGRLHAISVMQAHDGNFYGTYGVRGIRTANVGSGMVFRITSDGSYSDLYQITGLDGGFPIGSLIEGTDGNLYGTTVSGGLGGPVPNRYYHEGSVFRLDTAGNFTTLYSFYGPNGTMPTGIIQASDGNLYGCTNGGGPMGSDGVGSAGVIFRVSGI